MNRLINLFPDFIQSVGFLQIFSMVIETVIEVKSSEVAFMLLIDDFINFAPNQLLNTGEQLHFRVKVLIFEVQAPFMHFLKNGVYLSFGSIFWVFYHFICFKISFDHISGQLVLSPQLHQFFVRMHSYWNNSIIWVKNYAQPFTKTEVAIFRPPTRSHRNFTIWDWS